MNVTPPGPDIEHGQSLYNVLFASPSSPSQDSVDPPRQLPRARASSTAVLGVPLFSSFEMLVKYVSMAQEVQPKEEPYVLFLTAYSKAELHEQLYDGDRVGMWRELSRQVGGTTPLLRYLHCIDIRYVSFFFSLSWFVLTSYYNRYLPNVQHCLALLLQLDLGLPGGSAYDARISNKMVSNGNTWYLDTILAVTALPRPPTAIILHGLSSWAEHVPAVIAEALTFRSRIVPLMKAKRADELQALEMDGLEDESIQPLIYFETLPPMRSSEHASPLPQATRQLFERVVQFENEQPLPDTHTEAE